MEYDFTALSPARLSAARPLAPTISPPTSRTGAPALLGAPEAA